MFTGDKNIDSNSSNRDQTEKNVQEIERRSRDYLADKKCKKLMMKRGVRDEQRRG